MDLAYVTGVQRRRGRRNSGAREGDGLLPAFSHAPRSPSLSHVPEFPLPLSHLTPSTQASNYFFIIDTIIEITKNIR